MHHRDRWAHQELGRIKASSRRAEYNSLSAIQQRHSLARARAKIQARKAPLRTRLLYATFGLALGLSLHAIAGGMLHG